MYKFFYKHFKSSSLIIVNIKFSYMLLAVAMSSYSEIAVASASTSRVLAYAFWPTLTSLSNSDN